MLLEIQAPDLSFADVCEAAELFADCLGLRARYDGEGKFVLQPIPSPSPESVKPLVSVAVPATRDRKARVARIMKRVLAAAPEGAVLATDGSRYAILSHECRRSRPGWREVRP